VSDEAAMNFALCSALDRLGSAEPISHYRKEQKPKCAKIFGRTFGKSYCFKKALVTRSISTVATRPHLAGAESRLANVLNLCFEV
jgi:hypothetical protein